MEERAHEPGRELEITGVPSHIVLRSVLLESVQSAWFSFNHLVISHRNDVKRAAHKNKRGSAESTLCPAPLP